MRKLFIAAIAVSTLVPISSASAQYRGGGYDRGQAYGHQDRRVSREMRECRRDLRRADSRREYRHVMRECRRDIREARRDSRRDWRDDRRYRGRSHRGW